MDPTPLALIVAAYLLGAVPFGLLIGFARGVDIRQHGSRNIGATNAGRVLGRKWGFLCLGLDILKGFAPTVLASFVLLHGPVDPWVLVQWILVAAAAVLGHTFPVYLRFRGGKGVATTIGVALGIYPYFTFPMLAALAAYGVVRGLSGIVSAGSLTLAVVFPLAVFGYLRVSGLELGRHWPLVAVSVCLGLLIIVRHRGNIARLWRGEESGTGRVPSGG